MVDEPQQDQKGAGKDEAPSGEPARAGRVGDVADEGGDEGGDDEGEEDETGAGRGPVEDCLDAEGEDGVEGCEEARLDETAPEGGEEAARAEEGDDGR